MVDIGFVDVPGVRNKAGTQVDPATEGKLEQARALLASLDVKDYATEDTLAAILDIFELGVVDVDTGLEQPTTPADTQPISAASLPLPGGAATATKQDAQVARLDSQLTRQDTQITRLTSIRDQLARDATGRHPVTAHPSIGTDVASGVVFTAGGPLDLSSGSTGSLHFENPAGSGVLVVLLGFSAYVAVATSLRVRFVGDGTPAGTVRAALNHDMGSANAAGAQVRTDTAGVTGGTQLSPSVRAARDRPFSYRGPPILVPEGKVLSMDISTPGGLAGGSDVDLNVTWKEV